MAGDEAYAGTETSLFYHGQLADSKNYMLLILQVNVCKVGLGGLGVCQIVDRDFVHLGRRA